MAVFRPKSAQHSGSKFIGIQPVGIVEFVDESSKWDWADIYLRVVLKVEGSDFERSMKVAGSLERDHEGNITGGSVLNRMYRIFDVIGCRAGVNLRGEWEDEGNKSIKDIEKYLTDNFVRTGKFPDDDPKFEYLAYVYKKRPTKPGGKVYEEVWPKLALNTVAGKRNLTNDINFLTKKGHIKEATVDDDAPFSTNGTASATASTTDLSHVEADGIETL